MQIFSVKKSMNFIKFVLISAEIPSMRVKIFSFLFLIFNFSLFAQNSLLIKPSDIRVESEMNDSVLVGVHLFVRKTTSVQSVMLTETTKDPLGKSDNYAYRAMTYNKINGDESRFLNGKKLESEYAKFSLIDSTPEKDENFDEAFHIFIPVELQFGYPWSRNGKITIGKGTFINIRAFEKPYGDYSGEFYDNPYMFDFEKRKIDKKEEIILTDDYNPVASEKFSEISEEMIYSKGPETIVDDILKSLLNMKNRDKIDVVFAVDATGSMKDDIQKLREELIPRLLDELKSFKNVRLGLLLYRDYGDNFKYKNLPVKFFDFTEDFELFKKNLNSFKITGKEGGDIPEAVYEALYASLEFYNWNMIDAERKIILIGDAEPHPFPRGTKKYTKDLIEKIAKEKNIKIDAIITPDEKSLRGR